MSPLVLILFCHLTYTIFCKEVTVNNRHLLAIPPEGRLIPKEDADPPKEEKKESITLDVKSKPEVKAHETAPEVKKAKTATDAPPNVKNVTTTEDHKVFKTEVESGALLRGLAVVVVLTTIVIIYMALKTYCSKKSKHPVMVSKYGVRTRRSDIEMTPLPLDEDEEDETLFEVNHPR